VSEGYYEWKLERERLIKEANALGVSVEGNNATIGFAVRDAKQEPIDRAKPCQECGSEGERKGRFKCDVCVEKTRREWAELVEDSRRRAGLRREVEVARLALSPVKRWAVEFDEFSSPEELRRAALGEVE